jgi:HSP20 family molecular chaperone IbpA
MDDPKKKILQNFDWKSFEQFFGAKLPPMPTDKLNDTTWIENYVQDALKQAFPQNGLNVSSHKYNTEVFETHNSVVVKISIPDRSQAKKVRVLVGANLVKLDGLPGNTNQIIKLGTQVMESSCKAVYKNGILQLHLRKQADDDHFHEVRVRFPD